MVFLLFHIFAKISRCEQIIPLHKENNPPIMNRYGIMQEEGLFCESFLCSKYPVKYFLCMSLHYSHDIPVQQASLCLFPR